MEINDGSDRKLIINKEEEHRKFSRQSQHSEGDSLGHLNFLRQKNEREKHYY